jgi:hypothetical protein
VVVEKLFAIAGHQRRNTISVYGRIKGLEASDLALNISKDKYILKYSQKIEDILAKVCE